MFQSSGLVADAVQLSSEGGTPDLRSLAAGAAGFADEVRDLGAMVRLKVEDVALTVFPDGRCLVEGTDDPGRARALRDRYLAG